MEWLINLPKPKRSTPDRVQNPIADLENFRGTNWTITFTILTCTYPCSSDVKFTLFALDHKSELEHIPPVSPQCSSDRQRFPSQQSWIFGSCATEKSWISKKLKITESKKTFNIVIWSGSASDLSTDKSCYYPKYQISSHWTKIRNLIKKSKT